ncbi:hypothetical protein C8R44DRAFT_867179 [Mycena epipterygia]|nr:hypothetical protein C8R44DRAFT_867179 [Mycena epipterygia]
MSHLQHLAPAVSSSAVAGVSPPPDSIPTSQNSEVASALRGLTSTVAIVSAAAELISDAPVSMLGECLTDLLLAIEDMHAATTQVSKVVAAALVQPAAAPAPAPLPAPAPAPAPVPMIPSFAHTTGPWIAGTLYGVIPLEPLAAVLDNGEKWYAIMRGKYVGLTKNSAISLNAVTGTSSRLSDKCSSQTDALNHLNGVLATGAVLVIA